VTPVNDYTPLAGYEPETGMAVRETLFTTDTTADEVRDGSRDISSSSQWPGFQFALIMHDGTQPRVLSYWRNERVLENFLDRHEQPNRAYIAERAPDNPWLTRIQSRNVGQCDNHLADATMPVSAGELSIWQPPGAIRICEIEHVQNPEQIRQWWPKITSPTLPDSLIQVAGFQFFSAVRYPDNCYKTYLGFRNQFDLDAYLSSGLHRQHDGPFSDPSFRNQATVTVYTGEIVAWFQRLVD
jgi:hypothetical protein